MFLFGLSLFRFLRFFLRQPCHLICGGIIRLIVNDHHALGGFTVKPEETFLMQPSRVCPRDPFGWTFHEDATKWTKIVSLAFARYASAALGNDNNKTGTHARHSIHAHSHETIGQGSCGLVSFWNVGAGARVASFWQQQQHRGRGLAPRQQQEAVWKP
eukprot:scaffold2092_cov144-Amphora_coffeaeformis.AAC.2